MKRILCKNLLGGQRLLALGLLLLLVGTSACGQSPANKSDDHSMTAYDRMLGLLYKNTVPTIRPKALAALRQQPAPGPDGNELLLLDIRTPPEYEVSHLRGARFVNYDHYRDLKLAGVPLSRPIVVYCTVGARSEEVGTWLKKQGYTNVRNLYGGIFQWLNDGEGVVNAKGPTTDVHPYSLLWRPWLKTGNPVYK